MLRGVALALTVLTGFSGLVYEVTWEKVLATLLGSHSEATAAVLGLFLGGLALGYALFGRLTRQLVERALEDAVQVSERFAGYYHHGAPFSRSTLAAAWRRCGQNGGEQRARCRRALIQTQARLGDLGLTSTAAPGDS